MFCSFVYLYRPVGSLRLLWPDFWYFQVQSVFIFFPRLNRHTVYLAHICLPCRQKQWSPGQNNPQTVFTDTFLFTTLHLNIGKTCDKMQIKMLCLIICANNKGPFSIRLKCNLFGKWSHSKALQDCNDDDLHAHWAAYSFKSVNGGLWIPHLILQKI